MADEACDTDQYDDLLYFGGVYQEFLTDATGILAVATRKLSPF